jgi:hypothetical protein
VQVGIGVMEVRGNLLLGSCLRSQAWYPNGWTKGPPTNEREAGRWIEAYKYLDGS